MPQEVVNALFLAFSGTNVLKEMRGWGWTKTPRVFLGKDLALWISKVEYSPTVSSVDFRKYKCRVQRLEIALIFITLMFGVTYECQVPYLGIGGRDENSRSPSVGSLWS